MKKTMKIEGMTCNHCVMHVTRALKEVEGVTNAEVSLQNKNAVVELSSEVAEQDLVNAVSEAGYNVITIE